MPMSENRKQYVKNNREKIREKNKKWREENKDKVKITKRKYREKYRDAINAKKRDNYNNNPQYRETKKKYDKKIKEVNLENVLFTSAKCRAKRYGLEFSISLKDVVIPLTCPIFNLPLSISFGKRTDCSPSLDRINNNKGYIPGNIIVISWKANKIKNNATPDELIRIGTFFKSYGYDI